MVSSCVDATASPVVGGGDHVAHDIPTLDPPRIPTQEGPLGIRFDFNLGARVLLPQRMSGHWMIRLNDLDTGSVLFESRNQGGLVLSAKRFFVRFGIQVWDEPESGQVTEVLDHEYDCYDRPVMIPLPENALGDTIGWFPYVARFWQVHGCRLLCVAPAKIKALFADAYPHIAFVTPDEARRQQITASAYATYIPGLFHDDKAFVYQPTDFRHVGLHRTVGYILGVDPREEAPRLVLGDETRPIDDPYVCIAVQATSQAKIWNNPNGWRGVIGFLKSRGYRVICIDQKPAHGQGFVFNHIPHGAEDETGDRPLQERARWLRHAAAFVGLSSGLAWLAWAAGAPVVMISGFTHPTNEFTTPFRVINWNACNSCWNDPLHRFDHHDFLWCPRHAGTPRQFECTRLITVDQVISALKRLPTLPPIAETL